MAEKINIFQKQIKKNYNIIIKSPIKDLYQEYLLQIIIECLLNEPLNRNLNSFLIEDQLMKNEELLDNPAKVNEEPYDAWFIKVGNVTEKSELLSKDDYVKFVESEQE